MIKNTQQKKPKNLLPRMNSQSLESHFAPRRTSPTRCDRYERCYHNQMKLWHECQQRQQGRGHSQLTQNCLNHHQRALDCLELHKKHCQHPSNSSHSSHPSQTFQP